MELKLITDQAIGEAQTRTSDGLGFQAYARVLAQAALDTSGPFTVGIFGEWGSGKTSLMRMIEKELSPQSNVVTVWFNAWRYEKEAHPIVALVGTIVSELEIFESKHHKFRDSTSRLVRALRAVAYAFSAKSTVKIPGFAEIEASFVAKDMIDRKEKLSDPLLDRSLYYGAFNTLEDVRLDETVRVVVLIDDLDRCFPDQAIRLLESIKLVLAQQGFIFIIGVARHVIEGYLQHRYVSEYGIAGFQGYLYLDKIVQLAFPIPPSAGRMKDFCASILATQSQEISAQLSETLVTVAEALGGNPRAVIRFLNNVLVDLAINSTLPQDSDMEGIPIEYFAITRCLEQRWPDVFEQLAASAQIASAVAKWDASSAASHVEDNSPYARIAATLASDGRLAELLFSEHGKSWLENGDLRRASIEFLRTQRTSPPLAEEERSVSDAGVYMIYSPSEVSEVLKLMDIIELQGWQVRRGARREESAAMIAGSSVVCLCIGADALNDDMRVELNVAQTSLKPIVSVLLPGGNPQFVPASVVSLKRLVDFRTPVGDDGIADLGRTLRDASRPGGGPAR